MSVSEQLMAQRDAVLFGTWVPYKPYAVGEACLVQRIKETNGHGERETISIDASQIIEKVLADRGWIPAWGYGPWDWNDGKLLTRTAELATREKVLDVLDEAIRRAKELENE